MTYEEMRKYIADMVKSQFAGCNRDCAVALCNGGQNVCRPGNGRCAYCSINCRGNKEGTATRYDITTDQQTINEYIDNVTEEKAKARLFIQDGDALIGFTYLEINGTITITVHPDVNNNINNNSSWGNVRALLQEKTYITIQSATA